MASFTSMFSTPSPHQDVVDSATSELLMSQDWTKTFEIIDIINRDPSCCADMIKALKKRIDSRNTLIIVRTLQLIDALIKNCSFELHKAMSDKWYSLLEKLALGRRGPEAQNEALLLIQRCGKAFKGMQREAPMFYRLYDSLRKDRTRFPEDDEATNSAMLAPPKAVIAEAQREREIAAKQKKQQKIKEFHNKKVAASDKRKQANTRHNALAKLHKELKMVEERATRFKTLKLAPGSDVYLDEVDFLEQCHIRLQELIGSISQFAFDETLLSRILNINDTVGEALASVKSNNSSTSSKSSSNKNSKSNVAKNNDNVTNDLLDLSDMDIGTRKISTSSKVVNNNNNNNNMAILGNNNINISNNNNTTNNNDNNNAININNDKNEESENLKSTNTSDNPFDIFGTTSTYGVTNNNSNHVMNNNNNNGNNSNNNGTQIKPPITQQVNKSNDDLLEDFFSGNDNNSGGAIPLPSSDNNIQKQQQPLEKKKTGDDLLDEFFS